jgi:membrane protease YdiL (CAAX protease family)
MPTPADFLFAFTLVVAASLFEHFVFWPRFRDDVTRGVQGARLGGYRRAIVGQSLFALTAIALWIAYHRTANQLRLTPPDGWRLGLSVGLVALMLALLGRQLRGIVRLPVARRVNARPRLGELQFLLPHTRAEHRWFLALSLTAGFCEELLYRGYLVWLFTPWTGALGAFAAVVALFGVAHSYQGRKGAIRATLAGAVMALIVVATGWLIPAMIVHALVDAGSGTVGYLLLRDHPADDVHVNGEISASEQKRSVG